MRRFGSGKVNSTMYHFVGILFLFAAAVDKNIIYGAIGVCFFVLGLYKRKK